MVALPLFCFHQKSSKARPVPFPPHNPVQNPTERGQVNQFHQGPFGAVRKPLFPHLPFFGLIVLHIFFLQIKSLVKIILVY